MAGEECEQRQYGKSRTLTHGLWKLILEKLPV